MIVDKVRLEVAGDPPAGVYVNIVPNPNGDKGGFGWIAGNALATIGNTPHAPHQLRYTTGTGTNRLASIMRPITPSTPTTWGFALTYAVRGYVRAEMEFYTSASVLVSSVGLTGYLTGTTAYMPMTPVTAPATATQARVLFTFYSTSAGATPPANWIFRVNQVQIIQGPTLAALAGQPFSESDYWVDVTPSVTQIDVTRGELDAGSLAVTLADNALNPMTNPLLRSGRAVRLSALTDGVWSPADWDAVAGDLRMSRPVADVDPQLLAAGDPKATVITFTAEDANARLAAASRTVAYLDQQYIPALLETSDVPWNIAGNTQQIAAPPAARTTAVASGTTVLDLLARIRNSYFSTTPGVPFYVHTWVDRFGVLQSWDLVTSKQAGSDRNVMPDETFTATRAITAWEPLANTTLTYLNADATYGNALRATATAAGTATWRTTPAPVTAGAELNMSFNVRLQTAGRTVTAVVVYYNNAGVEVNRSTVQASSGYSTTTYLGYTDKKSTVPVFATHAGFEFRATGLLAGENIYLNRAFGYLEHDVILADKDLTSAPAGWGDSANFNVLTVDSIYAVSGTPTQTNYGPFEDAASRTQYGPRAATVPVIGFATATGTDLTNLKNYLLARNAVPQLGVTEVRIPIRTAAEVTRHAFRDVCDRVRITGTTVDTTKRVTSVTNSIRATNEGGTWLQTLTLAPLDRLTV